MNEQPTLLRTGKRGKLTGQTDRVFITLESLNNKFRDPQTKIPVSRKFAELNELNGVIMEKVQFEKIGAPEEPKEQISVVVQNLED